MTLLVSVFLAFLLVDGKTAYKLQPTNDELAADHAVAEIDEINNVGKYKLKLNNTNTGFPSDIYTFIVQIH